MKLLVVTEDYPPRVSGGATFAYELSRKLHSDYGVEIQVLTRDVGTVSNDQLPVKRLQVGAYRSEGGGVNLGRMRFILKLYRQILKDIDKFDAVDFFSGMTTEAAAWLLKNLNGKKKPMVLNYLGTVVGRYQEIYPFPIYNVFNLVGTKLLTEVEYDKYMVLDEGSGGYEFFLRNGVSKRKLVNHYQAVDCDLFRPIRMKENKVPLIGYFGRLDPFKGIDNLIEAAGLMKKELGKFKLVIRGDGMLKETIVKMAKEKKLEKMLTFVKPVPFNRLPHFINSLDLMVLADVRSYKNPNILSLTMCETMACGKLFISSSAPRKEWKHQTWVRLNKQDPVELKDKMLDCLLNKKKYRNVEKNARRIAVRFFDWDKIAKLQYKNLEEL